MTRSDEYLSNTCMQLLETLPIYTLTNTKDIPKTCAIYCLRNKVSNKCYIGQSVNIQARAKQHCKGRVRGIHKALLKHGLINFNLYILESDLTRDCLNDREIYWIEYFDSYRKGYNQTKGGTYCPKTEDELNSMGKANFIKTIVYNYKLGYYIECPSRKMAVQKVQEKGYDITYKQVIEAMLKKSYVRDFIFANSVPEIHQILRDKNPPTELSVYLYNIKTKVYSPKLTNTTQVTEYIKNAGFSICDHTVGASLRNNSKKIKGFFIAQTREDLEILINSYHPFVWVYDLNSGECKKVEHTSASAVGRQVGCPATYVLDCLADKRNHCRGLVFAFDRITCIEKAKKYLETKLVKQLDSLVNKGIL